MNQSVLCICYSRTGNTERTMREISKALDCEMAIVHDRVNRAGALGWLRCGMDAMRKKTRAVNRFETMHQLWDYNLVIIGTPVWAGRCSSVIRGFLKRRGFELMDVAYVITHRSDEPYRDVFDQMDMYLKRPHVADVSLRPGSTGYIFWRDQFIKACADFAGVPILPIEDETEPAPAEAPAEEETVPAEAPAEKVASAEEEPVPEEAPAEEAAAEEAPAEEEPAPEETPSEEAPAEEEPPAEEAPADEPVPEQES